ncbi:MAG: PilZ domain-containing protein [Candidatus Omnitrophica bacterium]|jgi:c-di-GMP-binding flagellar brake protein YcgR|nr:PilZ domain-containing protein [Candidatus Omnitrophota bacterium]
MIKEKRKYKRVMVKINLIYKVMGVRGEASLWTVDLGGGGLRLQLREKAKPGTMVEMGISVPPGDPIFFSLGRIVWQRRCPDNVEEPLRYYETGVEFVKMDVENRAKVIKFVHAKLKETGNES